MKVIIFRNIAKQSFLYEPLTLTISENQLFPKKKAEEYKHLAMTLKVNASLIM